MPSSSLFRAVGVGKKKEDGSWLFRNVDVELQEGVLTITGPSGVGKSTLLKCLNQILTMDEGQVYLQDKTPDQWGMPVWRSKVMYIPQRTAVMEGTPLDFVDVVRKFNAHKSNPDNFDDPVEIGLDWSLRPELWHSKWNTLSGGEMQRISLAIGLSFRPEILLLDEPTSALDEESCNMVEKTLGELNCIWVTHNPQQAKRISSAGTLTMRGGDNSPLGIHVEEDGLRGNGKGNEHANDVTHEDNNNHNGKSKERRDTNASTSSASTRLA